MRQISRSPSCFIDDTDENVVIVSENISGVRARKIDHKNDYKNNMK